MEHRKNLLMQLNFIDLIVVFDEKDVDPILEKIYFNILFKGGDYKIEELKKKFPNINLMISKHEENISTSLIFFSNISKPKLTIFSHPKTSHLMII